MFQFYLISHLCHITVITVIPGVVLPEQHSGCVMSTSQTAHVIHYPIHFVLFALQQSTQSDIRTYKITEKSKEICVWLIISLP